MIIDREREFQKLKPNRLFFSFFLTDSKSYLIKNLKFIQANQLFCKISFILVKMEWRGRTFNSELLSEN